VMYCWVVDFVSVKVDVVLLLVSAFSLLEFNS